MMRRMFVIGRARHTRSYWNRELQSGISNNQLLGQKMLLSERRYCTLHYLQFKLHHLLNLHLNRMQTVQTHSSVCNYEAHHDMDWKGQTIADCVDTLNCVFTNKGISEARQSSELIVAHSLGHKTVSKFPIVSTLKIVLICFR